ARRSRDRLHLAERPEWNERSCLLNAGSKSFECSRRYETGLVALRKHVVVDLKRKLIDSKVLGPPPWNTRYPESDRLRRRGLGVRAAPDLAADVCPRS